MSEKELEEKKEEGESEKTNIRAELWDWIKQIALVLVISFLIITFIGQRTQVEGHSMEPGLSNGDSLIVDKISYRFHDPERYDIIVFPYKYEKNTCFIKRIIGMPGETIQIIDGYVYINGEKLDEHYGAEVIEDPGIAAEPITLGDDCYFVLGDNRNHSSDSRAASVGVLTREDLIGRAWMRILPFDSFGLIKHQ